MPLNRVAHPVHNTPNLQTSEFRQSPVGQASARLGELLPAGTSVSEEIRSVFNMGQTVDGKLMEQVAAACKDPELRQSAKFNAALKRTAKRLAEKNTPAGRQAARLLEELQDDQELLADYRSTLLG